MSWSNTFSGATPDVKKSIFEYAPYFGDRRERHTFDRAKAALLAEIAIEEHDPHATGFISASTSGSGSTHIDEQPGRESNYASYQYSTSVSRSKAPAVEPVAEEAKADADAPHDN